MARVPTINYFASRGAYYCQINKVQQLLASGPKDGPDGPTFLAATERFNDLIQMASMDVKGSQAPLQCVLERWLEENERRWTSETLAQHTRYCQALIGTLGNVPVGKVDCITLEMWFRHQRGTTTINTRFGQRENVWGDGSELNCHRTLHAAFGWAIRRGLIRTNPVDQVQRLPVRSRGASCLVSAEQHALILDHLQGKLRQPLRDMIVCLHGTGARPSELIAAESRYFDRRRNALVYLSDRTRRPSDFRHKTAGRGKDRVIWFTGEALSTMLRLMKERPKGPLFRTRSGKAWDRHVLAYQFRSRLRKLTGNEELTAYSYRHQFATDWILAGQSIELLAEYLGNSAAVIRQHYAHLLSGESHLIDRLAAFNASR